MKKYAEIGYLILLLNSLAALPLSVQLYMLLKLKIKFIPVLYCMINFLIICYGVYTLHIQLLIINASPQSIVVHLVIGLILGGIWFNLEKILKKRRTKCLPKSMNLHTKIYAENFCNNKRVNIFCKDSPNKKNILVDSEYLQLGLLLLMALFEEIIYRGYLLTLADICFSKYYFLFITFIAIWFGAIHIKNDYMEFIYKGTFGALLMLVAILSGSILLPICAHMIFNYRVWDNNKLNE